MTPSRDAGGHPLPRLNDMLTRQLRRQGKVTQREAGRDRLRYGRRDAATAPPSGGWRQPLNGRPTSILTPLLDNIAQCDADVLVVLARVRLRGLAPASIEQRLSGGHTGRRWGGLGAADACQRADGQRGLCPRQRSNICCSLSHLGSLALHQLVHNLCAADRRPGARGVTAWRMPWSISAPACLASASGRLTIFMLAIAA